MSQEAQIAFWIVKFKELCHKIKSKFKHRQLPLKLCET